MKDLDKSSEKFSRISEINLDVEDKQKSVKLRPVIPLNWNNITDILSKASMPNISKIKDLEAKSKLYSLFYSIYLGSGLIYFGLLSCLMPSLPPSSWFYFFGVGWNYVTRPVSWINCLFCLGCGAGDFFLI